MLFSSTKDHIAIHISSFDFSSLTTRLDKNCYFKNEAIAMKNTRIGENRAAKFHLDPEITPFQAFSQVFLYTLEADPQISRILYAFEQGS